LAIGYDGRGKGTYKTLEVLGPEHEFCIVDEDLKALPIADKALRDQHGCFVNSVEFPRFTLAKELQLHVMELRPNKPFSSPIDFEETMQQAVQTVLGLMKSRYGARLLGTGMHPLLKLAETGVWPHRHRQIYEAYSKVFDLRRHGWLNIQSFQLNLPFRNEQEGVALHNAIAEICAYLPAVAASSPICEGRIGAHVDDRLNFYAVNQLEVPSVAGEIIPEYVSSFTEYRTNVISRYSIDMEKAGVPALLLHKEWVNSRGAIFRFDRRAIEIRVMDEQECVKSDVALSCFVRALLRGLLSGNHEVLPHELLVKDFKSVIKDGLSAETLHPYGQTARQVCSRLLRTAWENASEEEKLYLPTIQKRVENGNLSETIRRRVEKRAQRTSFREAIVDVYSKLVGSLENNKPYF